MHAKIFVRITKEINGEMKSKKIETSVGRIIFNQGIPQDLGFVNREEDPFQYEINFPVVKKTMGQIIDREIKVHGVVESAEVIDYIKSLGFKYSTLAGITFSMSDVKVPEAKKGLLEEADKKIETIRKQYARGLITNEERYNSVIKVWEDATKKISQAMEENFEDLNPIYMMVKSGARGNMNQLRQIAGIRGLMASTTGKAVEIPIKSSFAEGLDALEYFISFRYSFKNS